MEPTLSSPYEILYKKVQDQRDALETKRATITDTGIPLPILRSLELASRPLRRPLLVATKPSELKMSMAELKRDLLVIQEDMNAIETYIRHTSYLQELERAKRRWTGIKILPFARDDFDSVERALLDYRRRRAAARKLPKQKKSGKLEKDTITTNHLRWRDSVTRRRTKRPRDDSSDDDTWLQDMLEKQRRDRLYEAIAMHPSTPWWMQEQFESLS